MLSTSPLKKRRRFNFVNNSSFIVQQLPLNAGMDCAFCGHEVLNKNELIFYEKKETEVHLIIKPEMEAILEGGNRILYEKEKKKMRMKCPKCKNNIGVRLPFAPNNTSFSSFASDKVKLNGQSYAGQGWPRVYKDLDIEVRDSNNYFNDCNEEPVEIATYCRKIESPVKFARDNEPEDFEWQSLSMRKNPFDYQIQGYIEGLQRNLVVVLNTGAGKTLVASLLLARMKKLNPERVGLMLVERVPLVFQQGVAIAADTGLSVAPVCGENKTELTLREINNGTHDVLVVTAGSFIEMLKAKKIDVSLFSCVVFDECHHLTGGHIFKDVMQAFTSQSKEMQPRIIGLSASPFSPTSLLDGEKKMISFQYIFPDVTFYAPALPGAHQETIDENIELSKDQSAFILYVVKVLNEIIKQLKENFEIDLQYLHVELDNFNALIGMIRTYQEMKIYKDSENELKYILSLMITIEECVYMGVPFASDIISDEPQFAHIVEKFKNVTENSLRLDRLIHHIDNVNEDSKVLVFVKTRSLAESITKWARKQYTHMNPQKVVGHGGHDGMVWYGEQDEAIRKFSSEKDTNLLISTTVLEEGIDVAACDLVIGFSGASTLIQYIQMRGRARKKGSKFVIFETQADKKRRNNTKELETLMKSVLQRNRKSNQHLSDRSITIMNNIKSKLPGESKRNFDIEEFNRKMDSGDAYFTLYVEDSRHCNNMKIKVMEDLQRIDYFKVKLLSEDDSKEAKLYVKDFLDEKTTRVFLVYTVAVNSSLTAADIFRTFCSSYKFQVPYEGNHYRVFLKEKENMQKQENEDIKEVVSIPCIGYSVGSFENSQQINVIKDYNFEGQVKFTPKTDIQIIEKSRNETEKYITSIKLHTLKDFAFLMYKDQQVFLILTLESSPFFYHGHLRGEKYEYDRLFDGEQQICCGNAPNIILKFNLKDQNSLKTILDTKLVFPPHVFHTKFEVNEVAEKNTIQDIISLNDKVSWAFRCLKEARSLCFSQSIYQEAYNYIAANQNEYIDDIITAGLARLIAGNLPYFTNIVQEVKSLNDSMRNLLEESFRDLLKPKIPENHVMLKRVTVTPTRIISSVEHPTTFSRLIRYTVKKRITLIIVSFNDEDMSKVQDRSLLARYERIITDGFSINGEHYRYLLSTGSQLREHKGYFVKSEHQKYVQMIRNLFVPNPREFTSVAKYLSRLGMYGTADFTACRLSADDVVWGNDYEAENKEVTTDGSGLVSFTKAEELKDVFKLKETPSAFQIRYSGCKGVLVCVKDDHPELQGKNILFRKSMKKFENDDNTLCVVGHSKKLEVVLNREIITLLSSVKDFELERKLLAYLNERLSFNVATFENEKLARISLSHHMNSDDLVDLWNGKLKFLQDSYWLKLVRGAYRLKTKVLKSKMNMTVEKGALLIGIPDPYGVLKENEIFVQLKRKDSEKTEVIESRAIIYRNPCLHPGDYRVVTCKRYDRLLHLYNVVVLPSKNCKKSLAAQCSGGDLDGDKFSVIWDTDLVPSENLEACDYGNLNKDPPKSVDDVTKPEEIAKFFSDFMTNDSLGRIATLHLALCDILEQGAQHPLAIKLAEAQSSAVDYPKTGIKPIVPAEAKKLVKEYPDFMEKKFESSYQSKKTLGVLYRHCQSIVYDYYVPDAFDDTIFPDNVFLEFQGYEEYLSEAKNVYYLYAYQMNMILSKFNLIDETDVILSDATYGWDEQLEGSKSKISESIKQTYNSIKTAFRQVFFQNVYNEEEQLAKAYAWYYLVYNKDSGLNVKDVMQSFAWLVPDVLCKIQQYKSVSSSKANIQIGRSMRVLFENKIKPVSRSVTERMQLVEVIGEKVKKHLKANYKVDKTCFLVCPYGSTSIYLNEPESDIDVCVVALPQAYTTKVIPKGTSASEFQKLPDNAQYRHFLTLVVSRAIDSISYDKSELMNEHQKVPLIKFVTHSSDNPIKCDISMNKNGLLKTYYIQYLYSKSANYFIVMFTLVQWARAVEIIKSSISEGLRTIDTADFYALIIHILEFPDAPKHSAKEKIEFIPLRVLRRSLARSEMALNQYHEIGGMVLMFFRKLANWSGGVQIKWPVPGVRDVDISSDTMLVISAYARRAFHCLLYERRLDHLIDYSIAGENASSDFIMNLGTSLSYSMGKSKTYFEGKLSLLAGCDVRLSLDEKGQLILCSNTTKKAKILIKNEIIKYKSSSKAIHEGQLPMNTSRYFMEGASCVLPPQETLGDSRIKFVESHSAFEAIHATSERTVIQINTLNQESMKEWEVSRRRKFSEHVLKQFKMFPLNNKEMRECIEITTRFGCLYFINTSSSLPPTSIFFDELNHAMERGKKSRSNWQRQDFKMTPFSNKSKTELPGDERTAEQIESDRLETILKNELKRKKKRKSGVASSFTPGLLENNTDDANSRKLLKEIYCRALQKIGFVEGQSLSLRPRCKYKASVVASTSFELQLSISENLELIAVEERPLNWVHATLITGEEQKFYKKIQANADARILIATVQPVESNSDLYRNVLLKNDELVIPITLKDGKPIPNKESDFAKKVLNVRVADEHFMFSNGCMDASIVVGRNCSLKELKMTREFCEISFYGNPKKLQEAVTNSLEVEKLNEFATDIYDISRKFQEILKEEIEKEGDNVET